MSNLLAVIRPKTIPKILGFSAIILYQLSFCGLLYLSWSRHTYFFAEQYEHFSGPKITLTLLVIVLILFFYNFVYEQSARIFHLSFCQLLWLVMPLVVLLALTPPVLSMDAGAYVIYARHFFVFGQNPYLVHLSDITANPWVAEFDPAWWVSLTSPYGPWFTLLLGPVIALSGGSLLAAVLIYKLCLVGVYVWCLVLCQRIIHQFKLPESTLLLFALNPAILIHGILEGHNDLLVLLSLLLAIYYFPRTWLTSVFWVSLGVAIKYIPGVLLSVYLANDKKIYWKRVLPTLGVVAGVFLLGMIPFGLPLHAFWQNVVQLSHLPGLYQYPPAIRLANAYFPQAKPWVLSLGGGLLFFLIWYINVWRSMKILEYTFWSTLVLIFVLSPSFRPWYTMSIIGMGVLLSSKLHYRLLTFVILLYSFMHYFGV